MAASYVILALQNQKIMPYWWWPLSIGHIGYLGSLTDSDKTS